MLLAHKNVLSKLRIVLASQSPRRQQILQENLGLQFSVLKSDFQEDLPKSSFPLPCDYVKQTCKMKALDVINKVNANGGADIIISSDTIVVLNNEILEKPQDAVHAKSMLQKLSGNIHEVLTAVTIAIKGESSDINGFVLHTFCESTTVQFAQLSDRVIDSYILSGEPFDKAGGYGVQGLGSSLVCGMSGCYFNVMGFPVNRFCQEVLPFLEALNSNNN